MWLHTRADRGGAARKWPGVRTSFEPLKTASITSAREADASSICPSTLTATCWSAAVPRPKIAQIIGTASGSLIAASARSASWRRVGSLLWMAVRHRSRTGFHWLFAFCCLRAAAFAAATRSGLSQCPPSFLKPRCFQAASRRGSSLSTW